MKLLNKFTDGGAVYELRDGSHGEVKQDPGGWWGFETSDGYTQWEAPSLLSKRRSDAVRALQAYDRELAYHQA